MADGLLKQQLEKLAAENVAPQERCREILSSNQTVFQPVPPFWPDRVTVWFAQAEAQFLLAGIIEYAIMYGHVLSQMDHRIAGKIEDKATNVPTQSAQRKYLKEMLISRLSASETDRVRSLLGDEEPRDRKLSHFLRHLRSLTDTAPTDDNILRQLWLRRLPQHIQAILAAQVDLGLDRIADIADRIKKAQPGPSNVYAAAAIHN